MNLSITCLWMSTNSNHFFAMSIEDLQAEVNRLEAEKGRLFDQIRALERKIDDHPDTLRKRLRNTSGVPAEQLIQELVDTGRLTRFSWDSWFDDDSRGVPEGIREVWWIELTLDGGKYHYRAYEDEATGKWDTEFTKFDWNELTTKYKDQEWAHVLSGVDGRVAEALAVFVFGDV